MFEITEEKKKYFEEWEKYFEQNRNIELENKINNNQLFIDIYKSEMLKKCKYDFEHTYKEDNSFDSMYGLNKSFRYLFENGYKFIYVDKNSKFYKNCEGNNIIHSPFKEINKKIFILEKNNQLFYIVGRAFLPNKINKTFLGYVGRITNKSWIQITIFDSEVQQCTK